MLPRFKRDYGTLKCGYCKREVPKTHANQKFCHHNCAAAHWYDEHKRVGPKPLGIIVEDETTKTYVVEGKTVHVTQKTTAKYESEGGAK